MAKLSHDFHLPLGLAEAMPLFTPRGEESWVPGWSPRYLRPLDGATEEGMLFTTGEGAESTYWTCLLWQPEAGRVRYLRLTPASRAAFVEVTCRAENAGTRVAVSYDVTPLVPGWEAPSQEAFAASIAEWPRLIGESSACGGARPAP